MRHCIHGVCSMTDAGYAVFRFGQYSLFRSRIGSAPNADWPARSIQSGMIGIVVSIPRLGPTSVSLRDLSRPLASLAEAVDLVIAAIPRLAGPSWLVGQDLDGPARDDDRPGVRLLAGHLSSLAKVAENLTVSDGIAALEAAILMAAAAYQSGQRLTDDREVKVHSGRKAEAIRLIDIRLMDPDLTIESLAAELGVSRATLFRDFGPANGVKAYIRARRLALARRALHQRSGGRPSIAEIAHAHGFSSESHFSRAYSMTYGHTPGSTAAKALLMTTPSDLSEQPERIGQSSASTGDRR